MKDKEIKDIDDDLEFLLTWEQWLNLQSEKTKNRLDELREIEREKTIATVKKRFISYLEKESLKIFKGD